MAIQDFVPAQILTAAQMDALQANDYNWTVSNKTASYTLVAADKGTRIVMSNAGATTITVNTSLFSAGDTLFIQNIGAGTCTITAGTATVTTAGSLALAQWGVARLYFTSASAAIFFSGGGANYGAATGGTGVTNVTIGGVNYAYTTFTSTGTLTVTKSGLFDVLLFGGGGGGGPGRNAATIRSGSGGGASGKVLTTVYLSANQTVTIGSGGAGGLDLGFGSIGNCSYVGSISVSLMGGSGSGDQGFPQPGGCGGGGAATIASTDFGFAGGTRAGVNLGGPGGGGTAAIGADNVGTVGGNGGLGYDISNFIGGAHQLFQGAGAAADKPRRALGSQGAEMGQPQEMQATPQSILVQVAVARHLTAPQETAEMGRLALCI
jgi:hypothetical protein